MSRSSSSLVNNLSENFRYFSEIFTYKFRTSNINKFILLLRKSIFLYDYIDNWERLDEKLFPNKKVFYSELNLEDITDEDYIHDKKVFQEFEIKSLGEYHDLSVQSDT